MLYTVTGFATPRFTMKNLCAFIVFVLGVAFAASATERQIESIELPNYPALAYQARIQGAVVLHLLVNVEGQVEKVEVVSGHILLGPSAAESAKSLRFAPSAERKPSELTIKYNYKLEGKEVPFVTPEKRRVRVQIDLPNNIEISAPPMVYDILN